jgi:hypothetical protein
MGIVSDKGAGNFASPDRYRYTQGVVNFGMGCWEFRWYQLGRVPTLPRYLPVPGYLPNLWNRGRYGRYRYRRGTVPTYLGTVRYLRYRTYLGIGTSRYRYLPNCNKLFFLED